MGRKNRLALEQKKQKEALLDQTAVQWRTAQKNGDDASALNLNVSMWTLSFELYGANLYDMDDFDRENQTDRSLAAASSTAFLSALEEAFRNYDPSRGSFSHYLSVLSSGRIKDSRRHDRRHAPDASSGVSLEAPAGGKGEDELSLRDMIPDLSAGDMDVSLEVDRRLSGLTTQILNFSERYKGRQGNETRRMWVRIFYTEDILYICKESTAQLPHERDVFLAVLLPYLDFCMAAPCRTRKEVAATPMKTCSEVMPDHDGDRNEIPLPVPAAVSLNWLAGEGISAGASARSNQKKFYCQLIQDIC